MSPERPVHSPTPGQELAILLVEDSTLHVELISQSLGAYKRPVRLTVARTLAEARALLAGWQPDLAIVDLLLPDGKGVTLLPPERDDIAFPVIIMTSYGNEKEAVEAMKHGAVDFLVKSPEVLSQLPYIVELALREWHHLSQRKQAESELRTSEERFRSFFTIAAAGLVIIAPTGTILQANPAFCTFTGYAEDELAALTFADLCHPDDREQTASLCCEVFGGARPSLHKEQRYLCKDGRTVWGHTSLARVLTPDRQPRYCVGLVQDVTASKQLEEDLRQANRELDAFVHTVSHDLRSPLSPIIGYADVLRATYGDRLDAEARDLLAEISRQGMRMLGLLEDLLSLARVGYVERPDLPVACADVVDEVVEGLAGRLAAASLTVEKGELPTVHLPHSFIAQIFDNLIGNAAQYAGKDGGPIEVSGERRGDRVVLSVRDHGPGVPPAERAAIFALFARGSAGKAVRGTGVGLATVQKIARLYGGRVWVEETPGGGSTFWVELVDAPVLLPQAAVGGKPAGRPCSVLLPGPSCDV
jgi:PAS domain S-box-containing protein